MTIERAPANADGPGLARLCVVSPRNFTSMEALLLWLWALKRDRRAWLAVK